MKIRFRNFYPADVKTVREHMPYAMTETTNGIVAYDEVTGDTAAIFLCESWTPTSVSVHQLIIKSMVIRHGWFEECANFVFTTAGRKKMYGLVPANNSKARKLNHKLGFDEKVLLEEAYDEGVDYVLMELKREKCPFWTQMKRAA